MWCGVGRTAAEMTKARVNSTSLSLLLGLIFETPSGLAVVFKGASEMNCGSQKFIRGAFNATHVQQTVACPRL